MKTLICSVVFCFIMSIPYITLANQRICSQEMLKYMIEYLGEDKFLENRWMLMINTNSEAKYLDLSSFQINDAGNILAWIKFVEKDPKSKIPVAYAFVEIDSGSRAYRLLSFYTYNKKGKKTDRTSGNTGWRYFSPGSIMENIIDCYESFKK